MDNTLYTHPGYLQSQIELPIRRLAEIRHTSFEGMRQEIAEYRKTWAAEHSGAQGEGQGKAQAQVSLGNIFRSFGISIEETIVWREELYEPEKYLKSDPRLRETLLSLASSFALAVVTNNPVSVARRTFAALGVGDLFGVVVGLDTCLVSKPHEAPFRKAVELLGGSALGGSIPGGSVPTIPLESCVSIGDRYDIDIALPLELGMGGILVDGVEDVYGLGALSP
jgi:phosphoglycolate phosphatase/putative hydrolase of the HAD superfamily